MTAWFSSLRKLSTAVLLAVIVSNSGTTAERNFQKGVPLYSAQSCDALTPHTSSQWWYSWSSTTGFTGKKRSLCDRPEQSVSKIRDAGMEFVPMFWGSVPTLPLDSETDMNLREATYLLTFNEPDRPDQSNILPADAAQLWPQVEKIAGDYGLELVAPCTTGKRIGLAWYDEWLGNCTMMYGSDSCAFDYTCAHLYYQPWDAAVGSCGPDVAEWACVGYQAIKATRRINQWHTKYGKKLWLTEFACGFGIQGETGCTEARQSALMEQIMPILHNNPAVFRYSWYSAYNPDWEHNSLNELVWDVSKAQICHKRKWLNHFGTDEGHIQDLHECISAADVTPECASPLSLSMSSNNCFCAIDTCDVLDSAHSSMWTYKEIGPRGTSALTPLGEYYNNYAGKAEKDDSPESDFRTPASCFSGHTTVAVRDKGDVRMDALRIGDYVLANDGSYSLVYSFGHYAPKTMTTYVQLGTARELSPLEISTEHLIYVWDKSTKAMLVPAGEVKVGDFLVSQDGRPDEVVWIRTLRRQGAFSPLTMAGDIVVNGLLASNYVWRDWSSGVQPSGLSFHLLEHGATLPVRLYCYMLHGCDEETYDETHGLSAFALFGLRLEQFLLSLSTVPRVVCLTCLAVPALLLVSVGKLVLSPVSMLVVHLVAALVGVWVWMERQKLPSKKRSVDVRPACGLEQK